MEAVQYSTVYYQRHSRLPIFIAVLLMSIVLGVYAWLSSATPLMQRAVPTEQATASSERAKETFLANCLSNGAEARFCSCMASGLQTSLTTAEFTRLTSSRNASGSQQPHIYHAVTQVTEGCTIPLQLTQAN